MHLITITTLKNYVLYQDQYNKRYNKQDDKQTTDGTETKNEKNEKNTPPTPPRDVGEEDSIQKEREERWKRVLRLKASLLGMLNEKRSVHLSTFSDGVEKERDFLHQTYDLYMAVGKERFAEAWQEVQKLPTFPNTMKIETLYNQIRSLLPHD